MKLPLFFYANLACKYQNYLSFLAKLGKNENVNTGVLEKICHVLNCQVADIMEITDVEDNCLKREEK